MSRKDLLNTLVRKLDQLDIDINDKNKRIENLQYELDEFYNERAGIIKQMDEIKLNDDEMPLKALTPEQIRELHKTEVEKLDKWKMAVLG